MEVWEGPTDLVGMGLYQAISQRLKDDPKFREYVADLELKIIVDLGLYPVLMKFEKGTLQVTRDIEDPDVTLKVELQNLFDMTEGRSSMIGLFLRRKLKIKPFFKLFKIYKIFSKIV